METWLPLLALALGIKHSFDADHLVAVSNVLTRARSSAKAVRLSLYWSLGHLLTAGILTVILYLGRETLWPQLVARLEILVPVMLILVGLLGFLVAAKRLHAHKHAHDSREHQHVHFHLHDKHDGAKMGGIGLVHGLASNDELLLLLTVTLGATTLPMALSMVALFSLGVVLGMAAYSIAVQSTVSEARRPAVAWWANVAFSGLSILYAVYLLSGGAGLNLLALP